MVWKLVTKDLIEDPVEFGNVVLTSSGSAYKLVSGTPPVRRNESGRVKARPMGTGREYVKEYFPQTFNLKWKETA